MLRLENRVAVVTGAARGQGLAVAQRFAAEGATVVAVDLAFDEQVRKNFAVDGIVETIATSVDDRALIPGLRSTLSSLGGCHILYNNAGIYLPGEGDGPVGDAEPAVWEQMLAVHLTGPYVMAEAVLPFMTSQHDGVIINVSSLAGVVGSTSAAYTASKAGLIGLTKSLALTHGPEGVRTVCLSLGVIETDMSRFTKAAGRWAGAIDSVPLKRAASPSEIAGWAAFLASDEASYANGCNIVLDGGRGLGL